MHQIQTKRLVNFIFLISLVFITHSAMAENPSNEELQKQVDATERAFAKSMADRDFEAFVSLLSEEAVFMSGSTQRGRDAVAESWKPLFEGEEAPFSWEPELVRVLDSGNLALSNGPVRNSSGTLTGYYTSIWRQESPGEWKIIFDKGNKACPEEGE